MRATQPSHHYSATRHRTSTFSMKMFMNLSVHNDSDPHWPGFHDIYTPKLQQSLPQKPYGMEYIENIDVVTSWKGLSSSDTAEELLLGWEKAFQNALNRIVAVARS